MAGSSPTEAQVNERCSARGRLPSKSFIQYLQLIDGNGRPTIRGADMMKSFWQRSIGCYQNMSTFVHDGAREPGSIRVV